MSTDHNAEYGRYRKKPVEIDAFHWQGDVINLEDWLYQFGLDEDDYPVWVDTDGCFQVETLEGTMTMNGELGDWIIRGIKGEFYPCKPDIFEMTYEPATNSSKASEVES